MNKLSKKFIVGIVLILGFSCLSVVFFNTGFLEKYYLYQKRTVINTICKELTDVISQGISTEEAIHQIETASKVIIVKIENNERTDNDQVNDKIRTAFQEKGIGFQKYWLWEEDYEKILVGENRTRLYQQENLNYSLLITYTQIETQLFAITMIIPNISDAFHIINSFLIFVNIACIIIAIIFIILFIKKITKPLYEFETFASFMKHNKFVPLEIHTNDELENVADSLNEMGRQVICYQKSLYEKNRQMEELIDNVAHDLKTPITLIKLYATGIKDGIDDGTFLDTILVENEQMGHMVEKLLYVSRINNKEWEHDSLNLTFLLQKLIEEYSILAQKNGVSFCAYLEKNVNIISSHELLKSLFINLITNAVTYTCGARIDISLHQTETEINFSITNETENKDLDIAQIWTPYYVGEKSRNKGLSGTGLGLSIVKKICEKLNYFIQCSIENNKITFYVSIPLIL